MRTAYLVAAVLMFYAGRAWAGKDYAVSGSLHVVSENAEKQVCELRIGNATDAKKKLLLVSVPEMVWAGLCRDHAGEHVALVIRFENTDRKEANAAH